MEDKDLCSWLRENSSGVYRPAEIAADRIEELLKSNNAPVSEVPCSDGLSLPLSEQEIEQIESQLETELGWRYQPQMRHGFKMEKLWNKLVEARGVIAKRAR